MVNSRKNRKKWDHLLLLPSWRWWWPWLSIPCLPYRTRLTAGRVDTKNCIKGLIRSPFQSQIDFGSSFWLSLHQNSSQSFKMKSVLILATLFVSAYGQLISAPLLAPGTLAYQTAVPVAQPWVANIPTSRFTRTEWATPSEFSFDLFSLWKLTVTSPLLNSRPAHPSCRPIYRRNSRCDHFTRRSPCCPICSTNCHIENCHIFRSDRLFTSDRLITPDRIVPSDQRTPHQRSIDLLYPHQEVNSFPPVNKILLIFQTSRPNITLHDTIKTS